MPIFSRKYLNDINAPFPQYISFSFLFKLCWGEFVRDNGGDILEIIYIYIYPVLDDWMIQYAPHVP